MRCPKKAFSLVINLVEEASPAILNLFTMVNFLRIGYCKSFDFRVKVNSHRELTITHYCAFALVSFYRPIVHSLKRNLFDYSFNHRAWSISRCY